MRARGRVGCAILGPLPVDELYGIHRAQAAQLRRLEST
ncbi:hypothetical protein BN2537_17191 [Streptomyces venezuelae]|nr:hypothetical protein BN2537_17191 [Streptomyces venezuelae]